MVVVVVIHDFNKHHHRTRDELERIVRLRRGNDGGVCFVFEDRPRSSFPSGTGEGSQSSTRVGREKKKKRKKGGVVLVYSPLALCGTLPEPTD